MNIKIFLTVLMLTFGLNIFDEVKVVNGNNQVENIDASITNVINMIDNLPISCTLKDEESVKKCRAAYDSLNASQKVNVTNLFVLLDKENQIATLYNQISNVVALIDSLPPVNEFELDDEKNLKEVINFYNSLDNLQKELVSNYSKLLELSNKLENIYISINEVIVLIDTLPSIELIDISIYPLINRIETIYNSLSEVQKGKISNVSKYLEVKVVLNNASVLIEAIDNIPTSLTNESFSLLESIQEEYLKLSASQKTLITNYDSFYTLYVSILDAKEFNDLIDEVILYINIDNKYFLDYLFDRYKEFNDNQKVFITNYQKLLLVLEELEKEELLVLDAKEVSKLINDLPIEITIETKEQVKKVRSEYDLLEEKAKKYVDNYHLLLEAEAKLLKLENEEYSNSLNDLSNEINDLLSDVNNLRSEINQDEEESKNLIQEIKEFIEETKANEAKGLNKYIIIAIGLTSVFIIVAIVYIFSLHHSKITIDKEEF